MLVSGHDFKPNPFYLIQLMALLLLRHALSVTDGDSSDDDPSNFFSVSDSSLLFIIVLMPMSTVVLISNVTGSQPNKPTIFCSFSCFELLDFFYLAISWLGQSVFCNGGDKDKSVSMTKFCYCFV